MTQERSLRSEFAPFERVLNAVWSRNFDSAFRRCCWSLARSEEENLFLFFPFFSWPPKRRWWPPALNWVPKLFASTTSYARDSSNRQFRFFGGCGSLSLYLLPWLAVIFDWLFNRLIDCCSSTERKEPKRYSSSSSRYEKVENASLFGWRIYRK